MHVAPLDPEAPAGGTQGIATGQRQTATLADPGRPGHLRRHVSDRSHGFTGSYSSVRRFLASLEATHPQVTTVLEFDPGEAAQVDFGKGPEFLDRRTGELLGTWIFLMTLAWSRHAYAEVATWLGCHRRTFEWFNGVTRRLTIDNPKCAITRACYHDPEVQRAYAECVEGYGFKIEPCPVRDPKKKSHASYRAPCATCGVDIP